MSSWDISGSWMGEYRYDPNDSLPTLPPTVPFTLIARQGWFGRFKGVVQDDPRYGYLDEARIWGKVTSGGLSLFKQYPVFYVTMGPKFTTLREQLEEDHGISIDRDVLPEPIEYRGLYDGNKESVQGIWMIRAHRFRVWSAGQLLEFDVPKCSGGWTMRRRAE